MYLLIQRVYSFFTYTLVVPAVKMAEKVVDALERFLSDVTIVIAPVANQSNFDAVRDDAVRTLFDSRFPLRKVNFKLLMITKNTSKVHSFEISSSWLLNYKTLIVLFKFLVEVKVNFYTVVLVINKTFNYTLLI